MAATVTKLQLRNERALEDALSAFLEHLDACSLAEHSKKAFRRQGQAYSRWLTANLKKYPDAFRDLVGAEAAVTDWKRQMLDARLKPPTINQGLAAVELLYLTGAGLRFRVKRVRAEPLGEPPALTEEQEGRLRREATRRAREFPYWGARDAAIIWMFLETGARVEEMAKLTLRDVPLTERTGKVRLQGKGDQVRYNSIPRDARKKLRDWLVIRNTREIGYQSDAVWPSRLPLPGEFGMTVNGITKMVIRMGIRAGFEDLRPHVLRHTFAMRCRQGGMDLPVIQKLMGHAKLETTARYFRAGEDEVALEIERVFGGGEDDD